MRACACGERRKYACVWFGWLTSSVNWPAPVRKRTSSLRLTDWPITPVSFAPMARSLSHRGGALLHRLDDVVVAGAPAKVALELLADLVLGRLRMAVHEVDRAHDHAGRAEPALQAVAVLERRLHRVHRPVGRGEPLDRDDRRAVDLRGEHVARL